MLETQGLAEMPLWLLDEDDDDILITQVVECGTLECDVSHQTNWPVDKVDEDDVVEGNDDVVQSKGLNGGEKALMDMTW